MTFNPGLSVVILTTGLLSHLTTLNPFASSLDQTFLPSSGLTFPVILGLDPRIS